MSRLVPSDFVTDFFKIDAQENLLYGAFMDTMLDPRAPFLDWKNNILPYFCDGAKPCGFTSVADTARYVAAADADPVAPEVLSFAGKC